MKNLLRSYAKLMMTMLSLSAFTQSPLLCWRTDAVTLPLSDTLIVIVTYLLTLLYNVDIALHSASELSTE